MKRSLVIGAACALFAAGAIAGEATVYSHRDFRGNSMTLRNAGDPFIADNGMHDVGSIVVDSGRWEFCARPDFRGPCETLGPGRYASLREDWSHPVESVREIGHGGPSQAAIELFPRPGFRGPGVALDRNVRNLHRRGIDDQVSSLIVSEGRWELCSERRFEGHCRVFGPGEYPRLGPRLEDNVSSLRRVG